MHLAKRFYDLASETSPDAQVPVALALAKLNTLFYFDSLLKDNSPILLMLTHPSLYFGNLWDIYLMALLAGIITAIYYVRRRIV